MFTNSRLAGCLIFGAVLAVAAGPAFGMGDCGGDQSCTVTCPAANSCWLQEQCPAGTTCTANPQFCRPSSCTCSNGSWACNDNCADQCEPFGVSGAVPDGRSGPPLTASRIGSLVHLDWGASCLSGDVDYEVYEGRLRSRPLDHHPVLCLTGGTSATFAPASGNRYFLVVPTNGVIEGSYGRNSAGTERAPNFDACRDQSVAACP